MANADNALQETGRKKKIKIAFPHTYLILVTLCIIAIILTNVLPAGEFDRQKDAGGKTVVIADTFHYVDPVPISIIELPVKILKGMQAGADILMSMLIIGGAFAIINEAGAVDFFICNGISRLLRGKEKLFIPILLFVMSMGGITFGMAIEGVAFIPSVIALSLALGYDSLLGLAIVFLGSNAGYTAGVFNPFSVGIAQSIAEIPLYTGAWYRWILLFVLLGIASYGLMCYADRIKKDPTQSLVYDDSDAMYRAPNLDDGRKAGYKEYLGLLIFVGGFGAIIWGCIRTGWWFSQIGAAFFWMGIFTGILYQFSPNKMCSLFCKGISDLAVGVVSIGFARSISTILNDGGIMDTIVYYLAYPLQSLPALLQTAGIQVALSILNLGIPTGSTKAVATMPIIIPLSDLLGISRQASIFAFQCGDGITNALTPIYTTLIAFLAVSKIQFSTWMKFVFKIVLIQWICGLAMTIIAALIGY